MTATSREGYRTARTVTVYVVARDQEVRFVSEKTTAVVGETYEPEVHADASGPVDLSVADASGPDAVCVVSGSQVVFRHPSVCTITATSRGDGTYLPASASQTVTVTPAATTTAVTVEPEAVRATVTVDAPGAGEPTGTVTFHVDGVLVGEAPLRDGVAVLDHAVPAGASRSVAAVHSGDGDFLGSSASTARHDPTIVATVSSSRPPSGSGWYRTPVTVRFTCTATSAPLVTPCPGPVTLRDEGAAQVVTRTVLAADGGAATASSPAISIDRSRPRVRVAGRTAGAARCVAADGLSGLAGCTVERDRHGLRTKVVATAVDQAGNTAVARRTYRFARVELKGAPFRDSAYRVREGRRYRLVARTLDRTRPHYFFPGTRGAAPTPSPTYLRHAGKKHGVHRWMVRLRVDRGMARWPYGHLGVKVGRKVERLTVVARR